MVSGIARDIAAWKRWKPTPLLHAELDDFEASLTGPNHTLFCRFRVVGGEIWHCDFEESRYYPLLHAVRDALYIVLGSALRETLHDTVLRPSKKLHLGCI